MRSSPEVGKRHPIIRDEEAEARGYVRIVDESGEDYAFASSRFHPVELPAVVEEALSGTSRA